MKKIISFIKGGLIDISPLENIRSLNKNIKSDILAGVTVAIIALPLALAFGEVSRLGPVAGLWGAIVGGLFGGLFGGCMVGVSGPTAPKATQIAAFMAFFVIGSTNEPDLTAAFSIIFLSGLILVFISFFKISKFIHYTPYSVIAGFMCGIGLLVIVTQINAFLGLEVENNITNVFTNIGNSIKNLKVEALYVSIPSMTMLFLWDKFEKHSSFFAMFPAPLFVLIFGAVTAYIMNLDISFIGDKMNISNQNKTLDFYMPDFSRTIDFIGPAMALAALAVLDSLFSCKVADNIMGARHNSDRETFGQGMANMAAGLVGGVTTATATMRTVANIKFGAKTPLASIVHGLTLLAILIGLGPLVSIIPNACLAAILFKVGIDILDYRILAVIKKLPFMDWIVFFIVLIVTVFGDLLVAIGIGTLVAISFSQKEIKSIYNSGYQYSYSPFLKSNFVPKDKNYKEANALPVSVFQPKGPLFFGSVESLVHSYKLVPQKEMLIFDFNYVTTIDLTCIFALEDLMKKTKSENTKIFLINVNSNIKSRILNFSFFNNLYKSSHELTSDSIAPFIFEHYDI